MSCLSVSLTLPACRQPLHVHLVSTASDMMTTLIKIRFRNDNKYHDAWVLVIAEEAEHLVMP